ncbi:hypothetical protein CSUI_004218 [Cystoisospora suis]|uniref:Uncharacterized protein n=1 Tax=Cystoisospora suis TaxID=483139 RepID=A0A2C6L204_9APIC|nr:hypothetical protein CSUI_004218 [Cystoisospora suis]
MNGDTPPASPFFPLHQQHVYHPSSSSSSSLSSSSSSPEGNRSSFPSPAAPSGSRNTMDGSSHREGEIPSSSSSTFSSSPSSPWYSHPLVRAALVSGDTARVTEELSVHPVTCIKIYLLTEGVPSLLILLTFWHRKSRGAGGGVAAPVAASGRRAEGMYRRRNEEEEEEDLYDYPPSHQPYHMSMYMPQGNRGRHEGEGENCSYDSSSEASRKASHSHGIDRAIMMRGMYPSSPPPPVLAPPTYIQQHGQQGGAPSASLLYDPSHRNPKASSLHKNHSNSSLTGTAQDGLLYQPFLPPAYTIPGGAAVGAGGYSSFSYPHNPDLPSPPPYNSHPSCYQRYYPPPPGL